MKHEICTLQTINCTADATNLNLNSIRFCVKKCLSIPKDCLTMAGSGDPWCLALDLPLLLFLPDLSKPRVPKPTRNRVGCPPPCAPIAASRRLVSSPSPHSSATRRGQASPSLEQNESCRLPAFLFPHNLPAAWCSHPGSMKPTWPCLCLRKGVRRV